MKTSKLFIIFMTVGLCFCSCKENNLGNDSKTDLEEQNLNGKVKRVIEDSYYVEYKFGEPQKGVRNSQKYFLFNEKGQLIQERHINYLEGVVYSETINTYNDKGLELERSTFNSKGELNFRYSYQYDEKGNKTNEISYDSDNKIDNNKIFDEKGNKIEETYYDSKGKLESRTANKYDEKGNMIEKEYFELDKLMEREKYVYKYDSKGNKIEVEGSLYDSEGELKDRMKNINKYDRKGNVIEEIRYDLSGDLNNKFTYKYDKNDNEIEFCNYNSNGVLISKRSAKIDEKGNKLMNENLQNFNPVKNINILGEESININYDSKHNRQIFEYNSYGDLIKEVKYESYLFNEIVMYENEYSEVYDYKYDKENNWVIKTERFVKEGNLEKENATEITEREIEYYQ